MDITSSMFHREDQNISVLNSAFQLEAVVDIYESLLWTERFYKYGDCEIRVPATDNMFNILRLNRYLQIPSSESTMIIDSLKADTDWELGDYLTITGSSLERLLDRRIIWGMQLFNGNFQNAIQKMLNDNVINPSIADRRIPNFRFIPSTDPAITSLTIDTQFTGDNLYEVISLLCRERNIGFRVTLSEENTFDFQLYAGTDRSYDQDANPYVVFSPEFDNLLDSIYYESNSWLKTITLVGGEGEGSERRYTTVGSGSGLDRREHFTDARDISSQLENGETMPSNQYIEHLKNRGQQKLADLVELPIIEAEIETRQPYVTNVDFFKGDLVQFENAYGIESKVRIMEIVSTDDGTGLRTYPTFEFVE